MKLAFLFLVLFVVYPIIYFVSVRHVIRQAKASQTALIIAIQQTAEEIKEHVTSEVDTVDNISHIQSFERIQTHKHKKPPRK